MKRILLCIALAGVFGVAQAQPGNNGGGQGGCGAGQQTNGCGSIGGAGGSGGSATAIGVGFGQGGAGGAGGSATAIGGSGGIGLGGVGIGGSGGAGGAVVGSGNSANDNRNSNNNRNDNANTNLQGQQQGQAQGQQQGQAQSSRNDNRSSARNSNSNANSGNNSAQSVTVQGDTYEAARIPVSTAYAAPLAASNGTCMGSSSIGGQGIGFGISIGSTWNDESCDMRYDAEALRLAGMPTAALARLCQKAEIAAAMDAAGTPCPSAKSVAAVATAAGVQHQPTAAEKSVGYTGTDPIVRKRLGLPPLK